MIIPFADDRAYAVSTDGCVLSVHELHSHFETTKPAYIIDAAMFKNAPINYDGTPQPLAARIPNIGNALAENDIMCRRVSVAIDPRLIARLGKALTNNTRRGLVLHVPIDGDSKMIIAEGDDGIGAVCVMQAEVAPGPRRYTKSSFLEKWRAFAKVFKWRFNTKENQ